MRVLFFESFKKLIWRLFKGNLQFTIVTTYSLLYSGQHIFTPSSDSLTSLCTSDVPHLTSDVSSEDTVKQFYSEETVSEKLRGMLKVNWPLCDRVGARAQPWDVFSGPCSYFLLWLNPLRAPPMPTPKTKGTQQTVPETHIWILAPRAPCVLPSPPTSTNFFTKRLS